MTPEQIERVFGRGRLKMVTGEHVEVFREAVAPGERRRYTKRFLSTGENDFGQWTEREWRILARLIGHGIDCVPDVVQFDRGRLGGMQLVQTYDAGVTVDQWATLLPVMRDERLYRHVFEDCAHWWALAHHCLRALDVIHALELVHLDVKGDNVCIPYTPATFDPDSADLTLRPVFAHLALIDFAFALISRERLATPLPIGWQKEYDYQSPRLLTALEAGRNGELQLTRELDWRCDMYSLAAMLKRHLPDERSVLQPACTAGWTRERYDAARAFTLRVRECHDKDLPDQRPHAAMIALTGERLREPELAASLERGWTLAREANVAPASASPLTPVTRLALPVRVAGSGRVTAITVTQGDRSALAEPHVLMTATASGAARSRRSRESRGPMLLTGLMTLLALGAALWVLGDPVHPLNSTLRDIAAPMRATGNEWAGKLRGLIDRNPAPESSALAGSDMPAGAVANATAAASPSAPEKAVAAEPTAKPRAAVPPAATAAPASPSAPPWTSSMTTARSNAAVQPQTQEPREAQAPASPQALAPAAASTHRKSSLAYAARHGGAAARSASKPGRTQMADAHPASHPAKAHVAAQATRAHAPWASLEPPLWLHDRSGPGEPAAAKAREPRVIVAASPEAVVQPPAVETQAVPAAPPPATVDNTLRTAPLAAAASEERNASAAPRPSLASPASGAPVEERSDGLKAPPAASPAMAEPRSRVAAAEPAAAEDFAALGRRTLVESVPRIARQAEPEVARVLVMAASAYQPPQERAVADAALLKRAPADLSQIVHASAPAEARRFGNQSRAALASHRNVAEALDLQLRAFGADPGDPEIAGSLAALYLKLSPPQPEMARQVALLALVSRGAQLHATRMEDWTTFAAASALSGHEADARNALFVTLAVSGNAERTCMLALATLANYGERLRGPVEAVFYRIRAQGRGYGSAACTWPPNWWALTRLP